MASPHQVITGELLRRKGFWSAWSTKSTFNGASPWIYTPFWLLCLLATLLVTITGPSAAIAVIPGLDWFPISKAFVDDPSPFYVFNATTELWPDVVNQDSLNGKESGNECLSGLNRYALDCPAGGFRVLYEWSNHLNFDNLAAGSNISTPNDRGDTRRLTNVRTCEGPAHGRASAMSITSAISNALVGYYNFARNNFNGTALISAQPKIVPDPSQQLYSPRVDVLCGAYQYDYTTIQNQREMVFPVFDNGAAPGQVPGSVLDDDLPLNTTDFVFIASSSDERGLSINGLATIPIVIQVNDTWIQATNMLPCSIYAQWAPVSVWYEPTTADQVSMQTVDSDDRCLSNSKYQSQSFSKEQKLREARNMTITARFAQSINQDISFTTYNRSAIAAMLDQFNYDSLYGQGLISFRTPTQGSGNITVVPSDILDRQRADTVAAIVAGVVTDGLSRVAAAGHYPYSAPFFMQHVADTQNLTGLNPISTASGGQTVPLNITEAELGNYIRLDPKFERYGYGYKLTGNATTKFGIAVLLVHLVLAVGHAIFVMWKVLVKKNGVGNSFDTIGEMIALALNSDKSARIKNTCGGISESATWQEIVAVRETYEGHLEMVVGDDAKESSARPRVGAVYGSVREH